MIEAYTIGTRLTLTGDAHQKLSRYVQIVKRASEATEVFHRRLKPLNDQLLKASEISRKLNPSLAKMAGEFKLSHDALTATNRGFTAFNSKISSSLGHTDRLTHKISTLAKELDALAVAGAAAGAGLGSMGAGGGIGGGMAAAGGRGRGHSGFHAKGTHAGFIGFNGATLASGAAAYAGYHTLKSSYQHSKEYTQTMGRFDLLGFGPKESQKADSFAKNTHLKGISYNSLLEARVDAANATKHPENLDALSVYLAKNQFGNKALFGKQMTHRQQQALIMAAEISTGSGKSDDLIKRMDIFQKMYVSSGGRVDPSQIYQFIRYSKGSSRYLNNDAFMKFEPLIQEGKGSTIGVGLNQSAKVFSAGTMTKAAAEELNRIGLMNKGKVEINPTTGMVTKIGRNAIKGAGLFGHDPVQWVEEYLMPAFKKAGITKPEAQESEIRRIFSNTNVAGLVSLISVSLEKIHNSVRVNNAAGNTQQTYMKGLGLPAGKELALSSAYDSLMVNLGKLSSPPIIAGMEALTNFLNKINRAFELAGANKKNELLKGLATNAGSAALTLAGTTPLGVAFKGVKNVFDSISAGNNSTPVQVNTSLHIDGKQIANAVTQHQAKAASRAPAHGSEVDGDMTPISPMYNGGFR